MPHPILRLSEPPRRTSESPAARHRSRAPQRRLRLQKAKPGGTRVWALWAVRRVLGFFFLRCVFPVPSPSGQILEHFRRHFRLQNSKIGLSPSFNQLFWGQVYHLLGVFVSRSVCQKHPNFGLHSGDRGKGSSTESQQKEMATGSLCQRLKKKLSQMSVGSVLLWSLVSPFLAQILEKVRSLSCTEDAWRS